MTRRHYERLAKLIATSQHASADGTSESVLLNGLASILAEDNPLFDRDTFIQAVISAGGMWP